MASLLPIAGLAVIVFLHTAVAALATRVFRVRLSTRVGSVLYTLTVTPVVLVASTLFFTGAMGIGVALGGADRALFVLIGLPMVLGVAIDYVWMPAPDEVTLPDTAD